MESTQFVMDYMLSNSCYNPSTKHEGYHEYTFKGHCMGHKIHAKCLEAYDNPIILKGRFAARFEIIEIEDFPC